jgi:hypothetical protein
VGGQPVPHQGRLLPAERPARLTKRADQAVGAVGVELVVEGQVGAATADRRVIQARPAGPVGTPCQGADLTAGARLIRNAGSPLMPPGLVALEDTIGQQVKRS